MPYINQDDRKYLDEELAGIIAKIKVISQKANDPHAVAGLLNYVTSKIALGVIPEKRYWAIAMITGAMHNAADEFYRRYVVPYEDQKIKEFGDVF